MAPKDVAYYANSNRLRLPRHFPRGDEQSLDALKKTNESNIEGFVLQYWTGDRTYPLRLKIKTADYVRLHKIITGLNPKGIWEHLKNGYDQSALWYPYIDMNRPFAEWVMRWIKVFQSEFIRMELQAISAFGKVGIQALRIQRMVEATKLEGKIDSGAIRKLWAMAIQQEQPNLQSILFAMLSGRDYKEVIWKMLEPKIEHGQVFIRDADSFNGIQCLFITNEKNT